MFDSSALKANKFTSHATRLTIAVNKIASAYLFLLLESLKCHFLGVSTLSEDSAKNLQTFDYLLGRFEDNSAFVIYSFQGISDAVPVDVSLS